MASIATTIANAIYKVSTDETYANMEFATREDARASFTAALLFELGLAPSPAAAHAPVEESKEKKAPKKRAAKASKEAVVAAAAVAVLEQVKAPEVEDLAETMGQLALEEQPASSESESEKKDGEPAVATKKKPGPKPKAKAEPEPHVGIGAGVPAPEPAAPKKKPGPKPKAKPEGPVNVDKLTPTHKKHIKAIAEEMKVAIDDKGFLAYANAMSAEEWGAKALDDHIRAFAGPVPGSELAPPPTEFLEVEFPEGSGRTYLVDPATKFVYTAADGPTVKARSHVGVVGMLEFKDMDIDFDE